MNIVTRIIATTAAVGCFTLVSSLAHAADCKISKWGKDDEIGAANYVTPEQVLMATKLVKKGKSHPLGIVVDPKMPAFPPRSTSLQIVTPGQHNGRNMAQDFGWDINYNDDLAQLWFGTGPQIDGLGHLGESNKYYNCNDAKEFVHITGLKKLGVDKVPPLIGRGVLIDMAKHKGVATMKAGEAITSADLKAAMKTQGVEIRQGDVVLIHTGWTDAKLEKEPTVWVSGEPGLNNEAAVFLASKSPMAVGADTWGVEAVPPAKGDKVFYGHVTLLAHNGIFILETMNTGRLAKEGVNEFMFVLGQARVKGTVQMIINPVAMW
ncbi:MAG: cyclase family protein [Alphaproteobacteria bacterium]|mgnify:FL=1|jgi:kynurenine formamidase|nr:cyclase family protein [Alphaproteobacteria bacterium]MBT4086831.1 cyclase family protein [Alphaproteobacteria bacterium]MBT4544216.1 cyclase family protein [Alphaproteobacteria bacterium]MBT7746348.1 cyclase family protein [Alphaproteobacteria bacterium]